MILSGRDYLQGVVLLHPPSVRCLRFAACGLGLFWAIRIARSACYCLFSRPVSPSRGMDREDAGDVPSPDRNHVSSQKQFNDPSFEETEKHSSSRLEPLSNSAVEEKEKHSSSRLEPLSNSSFEEKEKHNSSRLEPLSITVGEQGAPTRDSDRGEVSANSPRGMIHPATPTRSEPVSSYQYGRTISSLKMSDEEFRDRFVVPEHLREAICTAVESQRIDAAPTVGGRGVRAPSHPILVMINSKSGGRKGPALRDILNDLLSKEQVYDLAVTPPQVVFRYGLGCLEKLAESGDQCARETRNNIRVIVAGGDGTVGWVLGSLAELHIDRMPVPSVGIMPLGTGNDLARSFGWGGSFPCAWRWTAKRYLLKAGGSSTCELDSWQVVVKTSQTLQVSFPYAVRPQTRLEDDDDDDDDEQSSSNDDTATFEGVFYNYFSIGMDAQVAYGFHHMREKTPHLAMGPMSNKVIYSGYTCAQGWFCTPCSTNPRARGLRNVMRLYIKNSTSTSWEPVEVPDNVRAVVTLNLQSYASGRNPWGHPSHEYNMKKGFVEPKVDDGMLEVFGLFDGWHASLVMLNLCSAKRLAQGSALRLELVADKRVRAYMQMDGEPWRQPLLKDKNSTVIQITAVPTRSVMLKAI